MLFVSQFDLQETMYNLKYILWRERSMLCYEFIFCGYIESVYKKLSVLYW
jgi:hypothetical protein